MSKTGDATYREIIDRPYKWTHDNLRELQFQKKAH